MPLLRTLQDWSFRFSAYHDRLSLADLTVDMDVMVMRQTTLWGKSTYDFTGVVVQASEDMVIIQNRKPSAHGLGNGIIEKAANLGLISGENSVTYILRPTLQNRLNHVYL